MKIRETGSLPAAELAALEGRLPFFKALHALGEDQLAALLQGSCLVELEAGETIMRRGESGRWLYFLLRGELQVFADEPGTGAAISRITPGEMFGDLALLFDQHRRASVAAAHLGRGALLFACDFRRLGDVQDFSRIGLPAKLLLYRTVVHSIRWRLEMLRMQQPGHELETELRRTPLFAGPREGVEELHSLLEQARHLARLLDRWNRGGGAGEDVFSAPVDVVGDAVRPG